MLFQWTFAISCLEPSTALSTGIPNFLSVPSVIPPQSGFSTFQFAEPPGYHQATLCLQNIKSDNFLNSLLVNFYLSAPQPIVLASYCQSILVRDSSPGFQIFLQSPYLPKFIISPSFSPSTLFFGKISLFVQTWGQYHLLSEKFLFRSITAITPLLDLPGHSPLVQDHSDFIVVIPQAISLPGLWAL